MREFKFRIWVPEEKEMFKNEDIEHINFVERYVALENNSFVEFGECELMQFTGLEDKNGVEIYEGDIVREQRKRFKDRYFVVEWLSGIGSYSFQPVDKKAKSWPCFNIGTAKNLEIVGNIYENKELLEE